MNTELLEQIGLNPAQAKVYIALIEKGALTPPQVSETTGESRTNAYMILDQLESLELIEKVESARKLTYQAKNPVALEKLSEKRRRAVMDAETRVKQAMPTLLSYYYSFTERPGVKMFEGIDGLKELYQDTLRTRQTIHLIRTPAESKTLGSDYINKYIEKRRSLSIHTYALTPDVPDANRDTEVDKANLFHRTWLPKDSYTAPVEVDIYGDKTAFMIFGEEIMGIVIDSPQLAAAMRQIFKLCEQNANNY